MNLPRLNNQNRQKGVLTTLPEVTDFLEVAIDLPVNSTSKTPVVNMYHCHEHSVRLQPLVGPDFRGAISINLYRQEHSGPGTVVRECADSTAKGNELIVEILRSPQRVKRAQSWRA